MVRLGDNPRVWRNLRDSFPNPYTRPAAKAWLRDVIEMSPTCHFAITVDGQVAGGMGLHLQEDIHRRSAELGYWLGEPFWGRGLMTQAVAAFTDRAFEAFKLERVYAVVLEWNPASARVLEKAGFVLEGRLRKSAMKDGVILDELLYARIRG
jgi:RimJ/RimL family protein N-acetyltransferase